MMKRTSMSIDVSGGSQTENDQMVAMIHSFMVEKGFTNVISNRHPNDPHQPGPTLADQIRSYNPELFDTPVYVGGECDEALQMQEEAALVGMLPQQYGRFGLPAH